MGPKAKLRLTASRIDALRSRDEAFDITDLECPGLRLHIGALRADGSPGTKSWQWRFRWRAKRLKLTLGTFPDTSIADAHGRARQARQALDRGIDPRKAGIGRKRAAEPAPISGEGEPHSIERLIDEYIRHYVAKRGKNPERAKEKTRRLLAKELTAWATRDARTITSREVVELLDGIVSRGSPVMANRFAGTLSKVFKLGVQRAIVETNPVQLLIPPGGKEKSRTRSLSDAELAALLDCADDVFTHARRTPAVIRLILHTACRRSEIALAKWAHFRLDGDSPLWTVPEELSKTGVRYFIPLVPAAVAELRRLKVNARGSAYVFPAKWGQGDKPADPMILTRSLDRNTGRLRQHGIAKFTLHDLRRTIRTGMAKLKVPPHVAELVLNHTKRGIEAVYDTHAYLDEKREALDKWAAHLTGLTAPK